MIVMVAVAIVCVVGILGALASTLGYDELYGETGTPLQIPPRSVRRPRPRRASRQLRAVEAALASDEGAPPEPRQMSSRPLRRVSWPARRRRPGP